ncbi:lin-54 homolog [Seminavis robusta]|uniref:Lin-54 homolog n=1 Tax=Seminavis robusta TaxID=568900 RepID=A0A9N8HMJ4_9STRA|nr:lin-54 homolog [Seminavis robusta]|eukprot:Sro750_g196950.1 lin-54 homolog (632) ;mRNA; r:19416-21600
MATAEPNDTSNDDNNDTSDEVERPVESAFRPTATHATNEQGPQAPTNQQVPQPPFPPSHAPTLYHPPPHHEYHRPIPVRAHETDYSHGHPPPHHPPPHAAYYHPPPHAAYYPPHPDDRRWLGPPPEVSHGQPPPPPPHVYPGYDQHYNKLTTSQSFPPPPSHMPYPYPQPVYPSNNRLDENPPRLPAHEHAPPPSEIATVGASAEGVAREVAVSPTQIESSHRDEVTNMGCTCKKTKCLKLYCQCFAVKIYCGSNCRCLVCFNTTKHEKQRKEAMRIILSRNPAAFDTKFLKTKERQTAQEQKLVLAHKLGCKCRKSACMKKYCECYAGNVKCSPNCRCIGCKNTISGGFGSDKPSNAGMLLPNYDLSMAPQARRSGREPWMMHAAHNLAYLKHGSPVAERPVAAMHDNSADVASMPSLAASSSDTSPDERNEDASAKQNSSAAAAEDESNGNVNSLLLAAMAMTEFQSRNNNGTDRLQTSNSDVSTREMSAAPQQIAKRPSIPRSSPKRKSSEVPEKSNVSRDSKQGGAEEESPGGQSKFTEREMAGSPLDPRELKRTRLGSVLKTMTWAETEEAGQKGTPENAAKGTNATIPETPDAKTAGTDKLTPISARCIDFKRMHVDEKKKLEQP